MELASTATPSQMREMFDRSRVPMLNKGGEAHGTITVYVNEKEIFEVTTLRFRLTLAVSPQCPPLSFRFPTYNL